MREAIGGGWLLGIVALFIALFSGFLAVSINHTKAFKVKNKIINVIENYGEISADAEEDIEKYMNDISYTTVQVKDSNCPEGSTLYDGGYCLQEKCERTGDNDGCDAKVYKVTTFVKIELPIVTFNILVPIQGETKAIFYDKGMDNL